MSRPAYLAEDGSILTEDPRFHVWSHPDYLSAVRKQTDIQLAQIEVNRQITRAYEDLEAKKSVTRLQSEAEHLVFGTDRPQLPIIPAIADLHDKRAILAHALEMATAHLRQVEFDVSTQLRTQEVIDAYVQINARILTALNDLKEGQKLEKAFMETLVHHGMKLGPVQRTGLVPLDAEFWADRLSKDVQKIFDVALASGPSSKVKV